MRALGRYRGYLILPLALFLVGCAAASPAPTPTAAGTQKPATVPPKSAATAVPGPPATAVALPTPQAVGNAAGQWGEAGHYFKGNPAAKVVLEEWTSIQ